MEERIRSVEEFQRNGTNLSNSKDSDELEDLGNYIDDLLSVLAVKLKLEDALLKAATILGHSRENNAQEPVECPEELEDKLADQGMWLKNDVDGEAALSMENQMLRKIGEDEFHQERAERAHQKFVMIPQDLLNFKRTTGSFQNSQHVDRPTANGSIQAANNALRLGSNDLGVSGYRDTPMKLVRPHVRCHSQVTGSEDTEHQFSVQPEIDESGNVLKHNPAWNFTNEMKQTNTEPLGLDHSFFLKHSRDLTLNQGVFPWRCPGNFDAEDFLQQNNSGVSEYRDTHMKQVSTQVRYNPLVSGTGEYTEQIQFAGQSDKYKSSCRRNHINPPMKLPFPSEYMLPKTLTTHAHDYKSNIPVPPSSDSSEVSYPIERQLNSISSMGSNVSSSKSSGSMASAGATNTSSKSLVSGSPDNSLSEQMQSSGSRNNCSEPVGPDVSSHKSYDSLTSGISHVSTERISSVALRYNLTDPRDSEVSSQGMESSVSPNMPPKPKATSNNAESVRLCLQSGQSTDLPSPSSMIKSSDNSVASIKSLEEAVSQYKAKCTSLMEESMQKALKRRREQKRKREREKIERQLDLRRQQRENNSHQPAQLPIQESLSENLCHHYKRDCHVLFPCCNMFFPCEHCHNNSDQCERNDRKAADATRVRCRKYTCLTEQEITSESHHCKNCKKKLSEYFCAICKLFTADDKKPYHCRPCGICRKHRDNSFHCDVCNVCFNQGLKGKHKCRPDSGHDECCICLEDTFSGCQVLACSHKVHRKCAENMLKNGVRTCPICRSPIFQN